MYMKIKTVFLLLAFVLPLLAHAQERNWTLTGYVKDLFMYYHPKQLTGFNIGDQYTNTLHNRLNFEWEAMDQLTVVIENRNRLISGKSFSVNPNDESGGICNSSTRFSAQTIPSSAFASELLVSICASS